MEDNQDLDKPRSWASSNIWVFIGAGIGAVLGLLAYTQDWLG
ncbi:CrcB family protein [Mobiluncus curtisii]|nr:CrcB family protein [Mobiluncus curtisii]NMW89510.1 CrcB family protein [Mobiluncus curtisii]